MTSDAEEGCAQGVAAGLDRDELASWARPQLAARLAADPAASADRVADLVDELLATRRQLQDRIDNPRDEHHTLAEIYDYRMLYNALAANAWAAEGSYPVVKSWRHSDGELCFGGGWFIVVVTLPTGQVSNHYRAEHWSLFTVPEAAPPEYDGHTPRVAAERMRAHLATATR